MSRHAFDTATEALEARLALDAATETADAFNDAYEHETHALTIKHARESHLYALPLKLWDATLDARLCRTCARLAGTVRPWGVDFPARMPAHPRCRCRAASVLLATPTTTPPTYEFP
jgi:hypothetical protein